MSVRARLSLVLSLALALVATTLVTMATHATRAGGASPPARAGDGTGRIVLVSGRDDHGLLATPEVTVLTEPNGAVPAGAVGDGTLAEVVATRGQWLEVRTVEGLRAQGWVDDFYLRGAVHLVGAPPSCGVRLGGRQRAAGEQATVERVVGGRVLVRTLGDRSTGWVDRRAVRELAPTAEDGCAAAATAVPRQTH